MKQGRGERVIKHNFLIVCAVKSGATSLYQHLKQHLNIYMSQYKEPNFYCASECSDFTKYGSGYLQENRKIIFSEKECLALLLDCQGEAGVGESSVEYLYRHKAPIQRVQSFNVSGEPRSRLIHNIVVTDRKWRRKIMIYLNNVCLLL